MFASRIKRSTFPLVIALVSLPFWSTNAETIKRGNTYANWINEDVRWIITDQERADFKRLLDNKQRAQFVEEFWERRNPAPEAQQNTFKEEHYRRLAYANQHFAQGVPGWKSDRGRFYIMYGPPDKIVRRARIGETQPYGLQGEIKSEEWHWDYIEGLGCDFVLEFVDTCGCGKYHLTEREGDFRPLRMISSTCLIDQVSFP